MRIWEMAQQTAQPRNVLAAFKPAAWQARIKKLEKNQ